MSDSLSEVGRAVTSLSLKVGGVFDLAISTEHGAEVVRDLGNIAVKLGALYVGFRLLKPVIDNAVRRGLGGDRDDQEVQDPRPGSLHVLLYCKTDKRFLEVLKDYESGIMRERLENEFSKIKEIKMYGLKVEITNMDEVQETKEKIRKRYNLVLSITVIHTFIELLRKITPHCNHALFYRLVDVDVRTSGSKKSGQELYATAIFTFLVHRPCVGNGGYIRIPPADNSFFQILVFKSFSI